MARKALEKEDHVRDIAYGGIVINTTGEILLREPKRHYGNYVWTFPKGRPNVGEIPQDTARREVLEETGVVAEIVARIPGDFDGSMTKNIYYLMFPLEETGRYDRETAQIRWATPEDAINLINQTTNSVGRERDLKILRIGVQLWQDRCPNSGV